MIYLQQTPADIAFSRNPVLLQMLIADDDGNIYRDMGVKSVISSTGDWGVVEDETILVEWTEEDGTVNSILFTAKDSPTTNELIPEFKTYSGGSLLIYYRDVADAIQNYFAITPHLIVSSAYDGVNYTLTAEHRILSNNVTVNFDMSDVTTGPNFTKTNTVTVTPSTIPDNHRVLCVIYFEREPYMKDWYIAARLDSVVGVDGITSFQVQQILHSEIMRSRQHPFVPEFLDDTAQIADNFRRYTLRFREDYDDVTPSWLIFFPKFILHGGIAQNLFAEFDVFQSLDDENSILSYQPDNKTVSPDQPEWLPWYNITDDDVNVFIRVRFYDDTNPGPQHTENYSAEGLAAKIHETVLFPVGLGQMDITGVGFTIWKYDVQVLDKDEYDATNPDVFYSQVRTYYVDHREYREKRYLMYLNGFGVPQTVRCLGDFDDEIEVSREESLKILTPDYSGKETLTEQYTEQFQKRFTYRTGYMTRMEIDALQEALIYNLVYEVYEEGYIPLYITKDKFAIHTTRQFLHSLEIEAKPAIELGNYSNVLIPVDPDHDGWLLNPEDYWRTSFGKPWVISP